MNEIIKTIREGIIMFKQSTQGYGSIHPSYVTDREKNIM